MFSCDHRGLRTFIVFAVLQPWRASERLSATLPIISCGGAVCASARTDDEGTAILVRHHLRAVRVDIELRHPDERCLQRVGGIRAEVACIDLSGTGKAREAMCKRKRNSIPFVLYVYRIYVYIALRSLHAYLELSLLVCPKRYYWMSKLASPASASATCNACLTSRCLLAASSQSLARIFGHPASWFTSRAADSKSR